MDPAHAFDLIVVGSGAAGLAAATRAHDLGLRVVVLEATDQYGGSTAISGGVVWIPDNPQLPAKGIVDSRDDALAYLRWATRGRVPDERLVAFVDGSKRLLGWLHERTHVRLDALEAYADYYPEAPGGKPGGRSMEPVPFDATRLPVEVFRQLRRSHPQSQVMGRFGITAREAKGFLVPSLLGRLKLMWRMLQYALRAPKRRRFGRDTKLHAGNALVAGLRRSLLDRDVPLWLSTPVTGLVIEDGRVVGVDAEQQGRPVRLTATKGVLLAAGGFERNQAMREQLQRLPVSTDWNAGNLRNQGDGIRLGVEAGAATDLMDQAWWTPVTRIPKSDSAWVLVVEKSLPGGIFVNRHGKRFVNEAGPYLDVGRQMYDGDAVPDAWLVFDARFRRDFPVGPIAPGWAMPDASLSKRLREGFLVRADTVEALAEKLGLEPAALRATIDRFNAMADRGVDEDFGRGVSKNDTYYADPRVQPNPSLRALRQAPFYAIRIWPGDLGTKGGLVTDAGARVLDPAGRPIPGLYAAGNTSAAVMGETYPGAGGTIGPAMTFGFLAAESAAADAVAERVGGAA
jgi:3-oxosteroid 1-dehydrogenase